MKSNLIVQTSSLDLQILYSHLPSVMLVVLRCVMNVQFCDDIWPQDRVTKSKAINSCQLTG